MSGSSLAVVLKSVEFPSALVETAFINNPREVKLLKDPLFQVNMAKQLATGIKAYFQRAGITLGTPEGTVKPMSKAEALAEAKAKYGKYVDNLGTAIRNHLMMRDMKKGKGPILMNTHHAMAAINKSFAEKYPDKKEADKKVKHLAGYLMDKSR